MFCFFHPFSTSFINGLQVYRRAIGLVLCEGPGVMIATAVVTAMGSGICVWVNYDQIGLLLAGKRVVKFSFPVVSKGLRNGGIAAGTSLVFLVGQIMMNNLRQSMRLAYDIRPDEWMCPWEEERPIMTQFNMWIARITIIVVALLMYTMFFLSANGHFFGQPFITKALMDQLNIDLLELDPFHPGEMRRPGSGPSRPGSGPRPG